MTTAKVEKIISALDIGSSKVSALIAGQTDTGELIVLGTGQRESRGVVRGCIADIEQAELSVRHAVEQAERIALLLEAILDRCDASCDGIEYVIENVAQSPGNTARHGQRGIDSGQNLR